jgi:hypothetical protein
MTFLASLYERVREFARANPVIAVGLAAFVAGFILGAIFL